MGSESSFRPRCPTCGMIVEPERASKFLPFCSHRCRMVDLGRWLSEEHSLPCDTNEDELSEDQPTSSVKLPPGWHDA